MTIKFTQIENKAIFKAMGIPGSRGEKGEPGQGELINIGSGVGVFKDTINSVSSLKSLLSLSDILLINGNSDNVSFNIDTTQLNDFINANSSITDINDIIESINSQLSILSTTVGNNTTNISNNTSAITNINTVINTINNAITSINSQLSTLSTTVGNNTTNIATNTSSITSINTQLTNINTAITNLQSKILPSGGTTGQVLAKKTNADFDVQWITPSSGGSLNDIDNYIFGYVQPYNTNFGSPSSSTTIVNSGQNAFGQESSTYASTSYVAGKELFYATPKKFFKQSSSYCSYTCGNGEYILGLNSPGFKVTRKFGIMTNNNATQMFFVGLSNANVALGAEQALTSQTQYISIGVGYDTTDSSFKIFMNNKDLTTPIKIPFTNMIGDLSSSDYQARVVESMYSLTMEYNPKVSNTYIKITFTNLLTEKSGYYNLLFTEMRSFDRTAFYFRSYQCLKSNETVTPDFMVFFYDCYRLYMRNV